MKLSDLFGESASNVTGEGSTSKKRHFLVGNPYMTYLNMDVFLDNNKKVLGNKYWTLTDGTVNATFSCVTTQNTDQDNKSHG